jgi:hypothetical protein
MWFYIPAAILIALFVWWFSRTNLYRHHRSGRGADPGQTGSSRSTGPPMSGGGFPG